MTRTAICVSGAFRGNPEALRTIEKNLAQPLNADLFFTTWDRNYVWPGMFDIGNFTGHRYLGYRICDMLPERTLSYNQIRDLFPRTFKKLANPVIEPLSDGTISQIKDVVPSLAGFQTVNENEFNQLAKSFFADYLSHSAPKMINQLKMFFMMYRCEKLLQEHEKSTGVTYDYVIKVRPDVFIPHPLTAEHISCIQKDEIMMKFFWCGLDDILFVGGRSAVSKIVSQWKAIVRNRQLSPYKRFSWASDHFLLLLHCVANNLKIVPSDGVRAFDIDLESVRRGGGLCYPFFSELLDDIRAAHLENRYHQLVAYLEAEVKGRT